MLYKATLSCEIYRGYIRFYASKPTQIYLLSQNINIIHLYKNVVNIINLEINIINVDPLCSLLRLQKMHQFKKNFYLIGVRNWSCKKFFFAFPIKENEITCAKSVFFKGKKRKLLEKKYLPSLLKKKK